MAGWTGLGGALLFILVVSIAFLFPELRSAISATIPTILVVSIVYALTARRHVRLTQPSTAAATLPPA